MSSPRRLANLWLLIIVTSTALAIVATLVADGSALTTVPLLWFLAVCPGIPYAQLLRLDDPIQRGIIAIGLSVAIDAVVAEALLLTDAYTATRTVVALGVVACAGAVIARVRAQGDDEPADLPVTPIEMSR
jgi:hypothetical protein